jgi:hypothetical protein
MWVLNCAPIRLTGNQLYIKSQSDDENFEPVEAYFFDPTEYLEEDAVSSIKT